MNQDLEKIASFIEEHHVMSLATTFAEEISVCSLFYAYEASTATFVVASSQETTHITHILQNSQVAGNILLETKKIGEIKGVQFRGEFTKLDDASLKLLYFNSFPYALAMRPTLWKISVNFFKLTDNSLGFRNKLIWKSSTS